MKIARSPCCDHPIQLVDLLPQSLVHGTCNAVRPAPLDHVPVQLPHFRPPLVLHVLDRPRSTSPWPSRQQCGLQPHRHPGLSSHAQQAPARGSTSGVAFFICISAPRVLSEQQRRRSERRTTIATGKRTGLLAARVASFFDEPWVAPSLPSTKSILLHAVVSSSSAIGGSWSSDPTHRGLVAFCGRCDPVRAARRFFCKDPTTSPATSA
jgi:hypothetical protein